MKDLVPCYIIVDIIEIINNGVNFPAYIIG
jgi:hypothetical protein